MGIILNRRRVMGAKHDDGHEYVDLGLPSGLLWATCNIGANSPEEAGLYFAWGETTGYASAADRNTALGRTDGFSEDAYNAGSAASISTDLTLENDAANVYWGDGWRMPTLAERKELAYNCTFAWESNPLGLRLTSNINGKSIFFPMNHRYIENSIPWSGRFYLLLSNIAYLMTGRESSNTGQLFSTTIATRYYGHGIRPVKSV